MLDGIACILVGQWHNGLSRWYRLHL